jgi:hypothetical protein
MYKHHEASIQNVIGYFQNESEVIALLLGGSIAHGFESAVSDVDVMILVSDSHYAERMRQGNLVFVNKDLCTYPEGYVDGKYISLNYLHQVDQQGSEPARFAFQGARVLFSREESLVPLVQRIGQYLIEGQADRLLRFSAQLDAWRWYSTEAIRLNNQYLLWLAVSKLVLFGGRLILAHNRLLYPYHKWFLRVLQDAPERPSGFMESIEQLYRDPSVQNVQTFYELVKGFRDWGTLETGWPVQFLHDSELNWQSGMTPIDDL